MALLNFTDIYVRIIINYLIQFDAINYLKMSSMHKLPGNGLEELGIPGQNYLRESLTSCTDPLKAIEEFQVPRCYLLKYILKLIMI